METALELRGYDRGVLLGAASTSCSLSLQGPHLGIPL